MEEEGEEDEDVQHVMMLCNMCTYIVDTARDSLHARCYLIGSIVLTYECTF